MTDRGDLSVSLHSDVYRLLGRRKLANRLAAGMLVLLGFLASFGAFDVVSRLEEIRLSEEVINRWYPISVDALEMEINALRVALAAVSRGMPRRPGVVARIADEVEDFRRANARIRQLADERIAPDLDVVDELWHDLGMVIDQLLGAEADTAPALLGQLVTIQEQLDGVLDDRLQAFADSELKAHHRSWQRRIRRDLTREIGVLATIVVVSLLLVFYLRSRFQQALSELLAGTEAIAEGNLTFRLPVTRDDELGLLALRFNYMARQLHKTMVSRDHLVQRERQLASANQALADRLAEKADLEEALRQASTEWRTTFDSVSAAILTVDRNLMVRRLNGAAARLLGLGLVDAVGKPLQSIGIGAVWLQAIELLTRRDGQGKRRTSFVNDSDRVYSLVVDPVDGGEGATLQIVDVSEIFSLRREVEATKPAADLGRFVAGVAHEVRNPLFAILANLEAWKEQPEEGFSSFGARIERAAGRLVGLMADLMEMARPGGLNLMPVDPATLVRSARRMCARMAEQASVGIKTSGPEGLVVVCDAEKIEQALRNLVENAVSFSPRGGLVEVELSCGGGDIAITVADRGGGIDPTDLQSLFEPFFTRRRGGTGLGLAIVRRVLEDHGGAITAGNRPGGGATFRLVLPATQGSPPEAAP